MRRCTEQHKVELLLRNKLLKNKGRGPDPKGTREQNHHMMRADSESTWIHLDIGQAETIRNRTEPDPDLTIDNDDNCIPI